MAYVVGSWEAYWGPRGRSHWHPA